MKTIFRRLRLLEEKVANHEFRAPNPVDVLLERRRRRAEANGLTYKEPVRDPIPYVNGKCPTWAAILRFRRSHRTAEAVSRRAAEAQQ